MVVYQDPSIRPASERGIAEEGKLWLDWVGLASVRLSVERFFLLVPSDGGVELRTESVTAAEEEPRESVKLRHG